MDAPGTVTGDGHVGLPLPAAQVTTAPPGATAWQATAALTNGP
ncbi:hypothetical protein [Amycolatopsis sp. Hca4]|nr:hypothetical protein [Amycolatopsis sp. Hca4]